MKSIKFQIRIEPEVREEWQALADREGITLSELIREAVGRYGEGIGGKAGGETGSVRGSDAPRTHGKVEKVVGEVVKKVDKKVDEGVSRYGSIYGVGRVVYK